MVRTHRVGPGDTLWGLARQYKTTMEALRFMNNLTGDVIYLGQELLIPGDRPEPGFEVPAPVQPTPPELSMPILPSLEGGFALPEDYYSAQDLDDIALLARLTFAEARGEPFEGQVAVAAVLLNRVQHPEFPSSVYAAVYQPRQFEVVANGTINQVPSNLAYQAVLEARGGYDPTGGCVFFWNPSKVPLTSWVWSQTIKKQIGEHVFA